MRRPWFFWGLVMYLTCFAKTLGMELVFIPLLVLFFIINPRKGIFLIVFGLILLRLYLVPGPVEKVQGQCSLRNFSLLGQEKVVSVGAKRYLLTGPDLPEGLYQASFDIEGFSKKRGPSGFCEEDYYKSLGIGARALNWQGDLIEEKQFLLSRIRERLYNKSSIFGPYQGLVYSLSFGLKEGLSWEEKELFSSLGLMHLFVVSGLHLGIYFRGIVGLIGFLRLPRILGELLGLLLVFFFSFLSDFHVSTLRSLIILILGIVSFHSKKKMDPIEALGFSVFLLLLFRPSFATSFSFILGTLSYGIIRISRDRKLVKMYLLMLPLQLIFVSEIKLVYYLANGILASLMGYILPLLMISYINGFLASFSIYLFTAIMKILDWLKELPWAWQMVPGGWFFLILFYLFLLGLVLSREKKDVYNFFKDWRVLALFLIIFLVIYCWESDYRRQGVHFLDVGQGDSSLILTYDGKTILIDTGRGRAIHQHLQALGINYVDLVFISHFDEDHSKEVENINYGLLYYPKGSSYPAGLPLEKGDIINYHGVRLEVYSPEELFFDSNEDSMVLLVEYMGRKLLFTGDVGKDAIKGLPKTRVDFLHYPHHGSRLSLDRKYYEAIDPLMVVFSYGKNRYGHPHREVIDFFEGRFDYFETGKSGSLHLKKQGYRVY